MAIYIEPFDKAFRGDGFGNLAPYRKGKPHRGQDWHPAVNSTIPAICDGQIVKYFYSEVLGHVLEQLTADGYFVQYAHLADRPKSMKPGKLIKRGQTIGRVGNTGSASTGPHLHLQMARVPNGHVAPYEKLLDPLEHIRKNREPRN